MTRAVTNLGDLGESTTQPAPTARSTRRELLILGGALLLAACTRTRPGAVASLQQSLRMESLAKIDVQAVDGDIFKFTVYNLTAETMVVQRDAIVLRTDKAERRREPGGLETVYTLPPGGAHNVNVRFNLLDLQPEQEFHVDLSQALLVRGVAVPAAQFVFRFKLQNVG